MQSQKLFLPVMLGILLIIAVLPPVSAESQSSDLITTSGTGGFTAGTGAGPAFFSPANFPAPFVPGDSSDLRAVFRSPLSLESLRSVNYVPGDLSSRVPSPESRRSTSMERWDAYFARPAPPCGCGGC